MAEVIRMPLMSDTMTEGVIVEWHKKVGDQIGSGDLLAEVETDKATMELESYWEGTLLHIGPKNGETIPVNAVLAIIGEKGEDYKALLETELAKDASGPAPEAESKDEPAPQPAAAPSPAPVAAPSPAPVAAPVQTAPIPSSSNGRVLASPLAKKMASDKGIDLSQVPGSGDNGRIVKRDVESFNPAASSGAAAVNITLPSVVGQESFEEVATSQMRKTIARRLGESKFQAPHFYLTMEINMDKANAARKSMNEVSPVKISMNDMVIKATSAALRQNPKVNSSWLGDKIRYNHHIHIGMAVAVDEGLVVPVIRFADNKSLAHIAQETKELAGRAREMKLQPEEFSGNTFTISNLGMMGIEEFTGIINPPDACIMAVGAIREIAGVIDGEIKPTSVMKVTLSCDHRVVDGMVGSQFLQTFKNLLEDPVRILI